MLKSVDSCKLAGIIMGPSVAIAGL